MRNFYLLFALVCCNTAAFSQTFISYGNHTISKDEFLKAYNKNKTPVSDPGKALREYVDLYTNFKLKVQAAQELRLDTLPQIQYDIANFRQQIAENYLSDHKGIDRLVHEAFLRMRVDKHVLHFSSPVAPDARPEDTAKSFKAIMDLYTALKANPADYNKAVQNATAGGAIVKSSDFGFITAFTLPYEFENIVYGLRTGELSKPYRSKNAWHLFKVTEERPSAGRWKVAQILVSFAPGASAEARAVAAKVADSVYERAKNGANFSSLAKEYSDDKLSYLNGGELAEFGTGTYSSDFEKEVINLKKDGDITKPFATEFGYHIVKRMGFTPTPTDTSDLSYMFELKQKVMKDARVNAEKEKFAREMIAKVGLKQTNLVKEADLFRYADSLQTNPTAEQIKKYPISNKTILTFKNGSVKGQEWLAFVKEHRNYSTPTGNETNKQLWEKFLPAAAVNYYKNHLEEYNPDFRFQMQEFKEGNMLFEIMERNVWSKASNDTAGLLKHYNAHKNNFKWAQSADVLIFNCNTAKVAQEAMTALKKGKDWRTVAEENATTLQADSGRYEISQIIGANYAVEPARNTYTSIVTNVDGSATFVKYVHIYPADQQRSFEEARGLVINDYQQVLENKWLAALKKKYPVRVNEPMLKEMVR
jgi:peptidyl-prolyl cis-trans isomerase SurA